MTKLKVQDHPGLVRDTHSKAIICQDSAAFQTYLAEKNFRQTFGNVKEEINDLKRDMNEIKELLLNLTQNK